MLYEVEYPISVTLDADLIAFDEGCFRKTAERKMQPLQGLFRIYADKKHDVSFFNYTHTHTH